MILPITGVLRDASLPAATISQLVPARADLVWPRAEDGSLALSVRTQARLPADLTGATIVFALRRTSTDTEAIISRQATVTDAPGGTATVVLVAGDTIDLIEGISYRYDVQLTDADGKRWQVVPESHFEIAPIIAQPDEMVTLPITTAPQPLGGVIYDRVFVNPTAAELSAALVGPAKVKVIGTVDATEAITLSGDDVTLDLTDAVVSSSRTAGGPDDKAQRMFEAVGTHDLVKLNTTLTGDVWPGQGILPVTAIGTIAAGDYVEVGCVVNSGTDGYGDSMNAVYPMAEILKVASVAAGEITLVGHIRCFHSATATGQYVRAITPVRRLTILGGTFNGTNVAVGLYCKGVQEVVVDGAKFENFTRTGMEFDTACRVITLRNIRHLGANNAVVMGKNIIDLECDGWSYDPDAAMVNATGFVRDLINLQVRPIGIRIHKCKFGRAAGGVRLSGGHDVLLSDVSFCDMNGTGKLGRATDGVSNVSKFGVAIDSVAQDVGGYGETSIGIHLADITIQDVITPPDTASIWLSDMKQIQISGLSMVRTGRKANGTTQGLSNGLALVDCFNGVTVMDWHVRGMSNALYMENGDGLNYEFTNCVWNGVSYAAIDTPGFAIKYACTSTLAARYNRVTFRNFFCTDYYLLWPSVVATRDKVRFDFHEAKGLAGQTEPCPVAYAETACVSAGHPLAAGSLVMTDGSVTDKISVAAATALSGPDVRRLKICVSTGIVDTPLCMIANPRERGYVLCSSAVVNIGDILVQDPAAPTMAKTDNAALSGILGIARGNKDVGASGMVEIGPSAV